MKRLLVLSILLLNSLVVFGQTKTASDSIVINSNPPITQKMIEAQTKVEEFIFSIRFTADERQKFQSLMIADIKNGCEAEGVKKAVPTIDELKKNKKEFFLTNLLYQFNDSISRQKFNYEYNNQLEGDGPWVNTMREAQKGCQSAAFLIKKHHAYSQILIKDPKTFATLYQKDLDGLFEWTNYRMKMVSGKKVDDSEAERQNAQQKILAILKNTRTSEDEKGKLYALAQSTANTWLSWRLVDYNIYDRFTPFQKKEQLVEWGGELAQLFPEAIPYAQQRQKEFTAYVNKMPPAELEAEYRTKQKDDMKFAAYSAAQADKLKTMQQGYDAIKRQLLEWSVTMSNINENIGNRGGTWVIKTYPY